MADCPFTAPQSKSPCSRSEHSPAIAHHAGGTEADGTRWATFWWHPREVGSAERPPTRISGAIPRPREAGDDLTGL
jgi:hypothetical protein